jgi:subtilisin-like proprotein convertase family protein/uncharacterized protein YvpB
MSPIHRNRFFLLIILSLLVIAFFTPKIDAFAQEGQPTPGPESLATETQVLDPEITTPDIPAEITVTPIPSETALPLIVEAPLTATITTTATITSTATITVTATVTVTETPAPEPSLLPHPVLYVPLVAKQKTPPPPNRVLFCSSLAQPVGIPDNQAAGIGNTLQINDPRWIYDLDVQLNINHTWVGDLAVRLAHAETGRSISLVDRPGFPVERQGCGNDHVGAILDDEITASVEHQCAAVPAALSGVYLPDESLNRFANERMAGTWTLQVSDLAPNDAGSLKSWCLLATLSDGPASPPPTQPPPTTPGKAQVFGVTGKKQALPLDCETRVAVDWANFFGIKIDEFEFLNRLPESDNPDAGFVGNVYGQWGQIPPKDYGVHAEPVAALLRSYGVQAYAHRPLRFSDLKAEIAAGRPVYVWVAGSGNLRNEIPVYYRSKDTHISIVARYEHTVMVIGYTESTVTILDGGTPFTQSLAQFLSSWSALGNMAIIAHP